MRAVSDVDGLIAFLRACLDREEQVALAIKDDRYGDGDTDGWKCWEIEQREGRAWPYLGALGVELAHSYADNVITPQRGQHIALHDPASVLADVAAKRAILELCAPEVEEGTSGARIARLTIHMLARRYAGWDGWRDEWAV